MVSFCCCGIELVTAATLTLTDSKFPSSSVHLKNLPPKNCTPMMEKMSQKTRQTRSTLKMDGIAYISALTTIWNMNRRNNSTYIKLLNPQSYAPLPCLKAGKMYCEYVNNTLEQFFIISILILCTTSHQSQKKYFHNVIIISRRIHSTIPQSAVLDIGKVKVKVILQQARKAQRGSRGIALFLL